ncbi:hypothetical protein H7J07_04725 [Mycobacterium koreense]|uniref:Uncharacterized protein n=1 Tax=Mycolicibacillus koreensis TaxID=1069220 RepID=A0A7I7SBR6_9MYCO|nr:hypothetical protein [Mycolicibacillus koreensis]MCV7247561.1 hypothetical protein [Mycolicibacillus koreensis]OSC32857.1 hypothetical protein B8W67_14155 [Mycolicibacillus koreensis]BBY53940.1 hypothetical protein MKOR_11910 [Mycolicibacillus koreensis]
MATVVGISPEEVLAIAENLKSHCETMLHADTVIHQNAQELAGFNYRAAVTATLLGKYETETNPKFVPLLERARDAAQGVITTCEAQMQNQDAGASEVAKH